MKIMLSPKEVTLVRRICYKLNLEDSINETMDKAAKYDYISWEESLSEGFEINISEKISLVALEVINKLTPKITALVGAVMGVVSLAKHMFGKEAMKEIQDLSKDLTYNVKMFCVMNDVEVLDINEDGNIASDVSTWCDSRIECVVVHLKSQYDAKKDLQNTPVGCNISNSVYILNKELQDRVARNNIMETYVAHTTPGGDV